MLTLQVFAAAILLAVGGYLVISQQITLGQLVASELIMASIVGALVKMGKKLEAWYDALAAMNKLGHIFDLDIEREDGERRVDNQSGAYIQAEGLSFSYGRAPLFSGLNFDIQSGSRAAIVGPHGSGGSTLLNILFGLRQPTAGFVRIDGLDLRNCYLESLRESVMLLRRDEIVGGTIIENLRLGSSDIGMEKIQTALSKVGLLEELLHQSEGLNLQLRVEGAPLSGNQRTRLLLARALVQRPKLLLIDELFDGLDTESLNQLSTAILGKSQDWTVVLTTRDHDVTLKCDQIIELTPCHLSSGTSPSRK
ncbi:MAG: ATP-binding cassette domain-containing protein [Actinobacteria bacterium]|nr:ATP-binding cassette domain-containing protein [Actinomycetota bacterium]